jgi:hypothetical protein
LSRVARGRLSQSTVRVCCFIFSTLNKTFKTQCVIHMSRYPLQFFFPLCNESYMRGKLKFDNVEDKNHRSMFL